MGQQRLQKVRTLELISFDVPYPTNIERGFQAVSYTHLTLPTIYSV